MQALPLTNTHTYIYALRYISLKCNNKMKCIVIFLLCAFITCICWINSMFVVVIKLDNVALAARLACLWWQATVAAYLHTCIPICMLHMYQLLRTADPLNQHYKCAPATCCNAASELPSLLPSIRAFNYYFIFEKTNSNKEKLTGNNNNKNSSCIL